MMKLIVTPKVDPRIYKWTTSYLFLPLLPNALRGVSVAKRPKLQMPETQQQPDEQHVTTAILAESVS